MANLDAGAPPTSRVVPHPLPLSDLQARPDDADPDTTRRAERGREDEQGAALARQSRSPVRAIAHSWPCCIVSDWSAAELVCLG
jgi:hypothetical protein